MYWILHALIGLELSVLTASDHSQPAIIIRQMAVCTAASLSRQLILMACVIIAWAGPGACSLP